MSLLRFYPSYLLRFLRYYLRAGTRYDVHSPFVSEFIGEVLENRRLYYAFAEIERLRGALMKDRRQVRVTDFGAGSKVNPRPERPVRSIARFAAIHPAAGRWLFHLARLYRPSIILELGTSLGISSLYLSSADSRATVHTLEGCPQTAALARAHFQELGRKNIRPVTGPFRETLPVVLSGLERIDLLFLDGDHRGEAFMEYLGLCLDKAGNDSVFILADIHWSKDMESAWEAIRRHPRVRISIDLFQLGILFFRRETRQQEHYTLIRRLYKPWRLGFFSSRKPSAFAEASADEGSRN